MEAHTIERAVRGHHIFKSVWQPVIGEILHTKREESNPVDRHAVAVIKTSQQTVGHMPREISQIAWFFLERGGEIECKITGGRRLSPISGKCLEVPCQYTFRGKDELVKKLIRLLPS